VNCNEVSELVDAYLDGELDPVTNKEIEAHLQNCSACDQLFKEHHAVVGAIGAVAPYHKAPAGLRERVQAALRDQIPASAAGAAPELESDVTRKQRDVRTLLFEMPWNWLGLAAALAVAVLLVWNLAPDLRRPGAEQFLATELIASHVRSLMVDHLTDVASSDQHTVKPWFDGKLDFAPAVADLADHGFPLVGGRLDYVRNRPTAALVYARQKHFINLFVWPAAQQKDGNPGQWSRHGFNVVHWNGHEMSYWAVSDLNTAELEEFAGLIRERTTPPSP